MEVEAPLEAEAEATLEVVAKASLEAALEASVTAQAASEAEDMLGVGAVWDTVDTPEAEEDMVEVVVSPRELEDWGNLLL